MPQVRGSDPISYKIGIIDGPWIHTYPYEDEPKILESTANPIIYEGPTH